MINMHEVMKGAFDRRMDIAAFSLGGFNIYWYGLTVSLAIVAGVAVTACNLWLQRENFERVVDLLLWGIPVGFLFARGFYVLFHWPLFAGNLTEVFMLQHGGFSVYGALIGFILVIFFYTYLRNLCFWRWLDLLVPAILLGLAIDQLGHFFFQANVGLPMAREAAYQSRIVEYVEYAFRPLGFEGYEYFWPVALYQSLWQLTVFFLAVLFSFLRIAGRRFRDGNLFLGCMVLVCLGRFGFGFLYLTTEPGSGLHFGQVVSLVALCVCGAFLVRRNFKVARKAAKAAFRY